MPNLEQGLDYWRGRVDQTLEGLGESLDQLREDLRAIEQKLDDLPRWNPHPPWQGNGLKAKFKHPLVQGAGGAGAIVGLVEVAKLILAHL